MQETSEASCGNRTRPFALARRRHPSRPTKQHKARKETLSVVSAPRPSDAGERIRTSTKLGLSQSPLPIGSRQQNHLQLRRINVWCRRRESNPHQLVSKTSASARLGYTGTTDCGLRIADCGFKLNDSSIRNPQSAIRNSMGPAGLEPATSSSASLRSDPSELRARELGRRQKAEGRRQAKSDKTKEQYSSFCLLPDF